MTKSTIPEDAPLCACGCGEHVSAWRRKFNTYVRHHHMRGRYKGAAHHRYKGGIHIRGHYVRVLQPEHHRADANGYVKLSVLVAEAMLGRPIDRTEIVHHKNHDRLDDRPENLQVLPSNSAHARLHTIERNRELGRRRSGVKHPQARFTTDTLMEIRALAGTMSINKLAKRFGVNPKTAKMAITGQRYRD